MSMKSEQSNQTKKRIMDVARYLAIEKGLNNMTIRDICHAANISIGAFYHHYASKQELVNESFMIYDELLEKNRTKYNLENPLESLKAVLLDQTAFVVSFDKQLVIEYYKSILLSMNKQAVSWERSYYRHVLDCTKKAVNDGLIKDSFAPEYVASFFIKFVRGNIINWCLNEPNVAFLQETESEIDLLLKLFGSE
ncbi:MAG: TetR/AcrR family transcriptional regulator [Eubacteriales bacterium]|nr:TetR/AcrR family transcriptional regulator [Eubacteriales bacterium]